VVDEEGILGRQSLAWVAEDAREDGGVTQRAVEEERVCGHRVAEGRRWRRR